jgi:hypothetical protein
MRSVTWPQVLAWRLARQLLVPRGSAAPAEIARAICGVQAQVASAAELAVAVRQQKPEPGAVDRALWDDRTLVKTWLMRGTLHLVAAQDLPTYCATLSRLHPWTSKAWQRYHGANPDEVEGIVAAIAEALDGRVMTREELLEEIVARMDAPHLAEPLRSGWGQLLKPAAMRGLLCSGPPRGSRVTFTRPDTWLESWTARDPADAGPDLVRAYLRAHGPASVETFATWWARGRPSQVRPWFADLDLAEVDVEGQRLQLLAEDADELAAQKPDASVRLLPGFDQYVLATARDIEALVPDAVRSKIFRTAGWVSPVVVYGGRVAGVWESEEVTLFEPVPEDLLAGERERLGMA